MTSEADRWYLSLQHGDRARIETVLAAAVGRFDEAIASLPDFSRAESVVTAAHFVRAVVWTAALDFPIDHPDRRLFYDAAISTVTRLLERDRDHPEEG